MSHSLLNNDLIEGVIDIAHAAGIAILDVYQTEFEIYIKEDKRRDEIFYSPVTEADKRANTIIINRLKKITPNIPIISEESQEIPY